MRDARRPCEPPAFHERSFVRGPWGRADGCTDYIEMVQNKKEEIEKQAEVYKVLSNQKRLEIVRLLGEGERSVDELSKALRLRKANVSQHLTHLRYARLVKGRREGTKVFYHLTNPRILKMQDILSEFFDGMR